MKDLKSKELTEKSIPELEAMVTDLRAELYRARRDLVFRKVTDTTGLKVRRHNIARLMTAINEKKRGEA
ncbi:MAG TPA: 50S ribosomal protein L29 [Fimbriimonas sp.]